MERRFCTMVLGLAIVMGMAPPSPAAPAQTPTIDQSLSLSSVTRAVISPDGRLVVYQVQGTNWTDNAFETELWIATTDGSTRYPLTHAKKSSSEPVWSPDSKQIAFLSDRNGSRQIYLIAPGGGEARQLTFGDEPVKALRWSPDGKYLAFSAEPPQSKPAKERKEKYGDFEVVKGDYTMTHLWLLEVAREAVQQPPQALTEGTSFSVDDFSWSPESKRIAFSASRDPDLSSTDTFDIYVLNLGDHAVQKIVSTPGPDRNPVWSPDGSEIAYETAAGDPNFFYTNTYLAVVPSRGGASRVLTRTFDEEANLLAWSTGAIYFSALQKTASHLFRLDPKTQAIAQVSDPDPLVLSQFTCTQTCTQAAFIAAQPDTYPEVYTTALQTFKPQRLTTLGEQFKPFRLAQREVVTWTSSDGTPIEGVLFKPADFDPKKKYPLLVVIHGGPTGVDQPILRADRYYPIEQFVAKGALVLKPNYRGSAGYGQKFRALNVRNLGLGDYADILSGVDHLIAQGLVDSRRVGAMGWSQGGYISAFITTYSDRFRAVSVGAGISDWVTYYVNTDIHPFTRQYLQATPWNDPEIYRKTSPMSYIQTAKTPTLIQHGENDRRVPIPNAYELYQGLEDQGIPVKMLVYKGFGHSIDKPRQQRSILEENYAWFSRWIWGEKMPSSGSNSWVSSTRSATQ
ncbi:S9 family peptidase [Anthocerotibacter panamensis]|uniref:S9 family peptidase n=1 Tax=Anthocerotibacter panamensis TaxID=2857077 RepID=UPI001C403A3F|nr:S9 family peptidase [Anthocerotibacter panamensis]